MISHAVAADAAGLAALHAACLPASLLSALGARALERYYRFAIAAPTELVLAARSGADLAGGCVLSCAPETLLRRFVRGAPWSLARELVRELVVSRDLRRRCWQRVRERGDTQPEDHLPEITQIFTNERLRGQGVGAELVRTCEGYLRERHHAGYRIHTHRDDNHDAIRFYRRSGFHQVGEIHSFGDAFVVMKKELR